MASLCKLLELLAPVERPLSELVAELPRADARPPRSSSARGRSRAPSCASSTSGSRTANVDLLDGIKVFDERGWVQVLPDPDEPVVHIYAEGDTAEESEELEEELRRDRRASVIERGASCVVRS